MIKKIKVYDMDGTFIDSSHRFRTDETGTKIDLDYWIANDIPEKIFQDTFLDLKEWVVRDLQREDTFVIFATARACLPGDANYQYLEMHDIFPDLFIHRKGREDKRGGAQLKLAGIKPLLNLKPFKNATVHIYEDNIKYLQDMTIAIKELGFKTVGHFIPSRQGH